MASESMQFIIELQRDTLITQLTVIAALKENDKLCVCDGHIQIDMSWPHMQFISRFVHGESRGNCILFIKGIVKSTKEEIQQCISQCRHGQSDWIKNDNMRSFVETSLSLFTSATKGLAFLCITYKSDRNVTSAINGIISDINKFVDSHSHFIDG